MIRPASGIDFTAYNTNHSTTLAAAESGSSASAAAHSAPASPADEYCDPSADRRPIEIIPGVLTVELGDSHGACGCGTTGFSWIGDAFEIAGVRIDMTNACKVHDDCSVPIGEKMDRSLGEVAQCQIDFASEMLKSGDGSFLGTIGSAALTAIYVPVVSTVALGQWVASQVIDGANFVWDGACSAWESMSSLWE